MSTDKATSQRQSVRCTLPANVCGGGSHSLPSSAAATSLGDGISGSAMALPPPKPATCPVRPQDTGARTAKGRPRNTALVSKSDTTNCKTKQVTEVSDDRSQELRDVLVHLYLQCFSLACLQIINSRRLAYHTMLIIVFYR